MHWAATGGSREVVDTLLQYGATTDVQTPDGFFPAHLALQNSHMHLMDMLIPGPLDHRLLDSLDHCATTPEAAHWIDTMRAQGQSRPTSYQMANVTYQQQTLQRPSYGSYDDGYDMYGQDPGYHGAEYGYNTLEAQGYYEGGQDYYPQDQGNEYEQGFHSNYGAHYSQEYGQEYDEYGNPLGAGGHEYYQDGYGSQHGGYGSQHGQMYQQPPPIQKNEKDYY